jgi:hypothetical protein
MSVVFALIRWKMLTVPAKDIVPILLLAHRTHETETFTSLSEILCMCAFQEFQALTIVNWRAASCRNYWIMWLQNMHNCAMKGHTFKNVPVVVLVSFDIPVPCTIYLCGLCDKHFFCSYLSHICIPSTHKAKTIHNIIDNVCVGELQSWETSSWNALPPPPPPNLRTIFQPCDIVICVIHIFDPFMIRVAPKLTFCSDKAQFYLNVSQTWNFLN